jgi:ATP-dependent DNA helicase PIF1
MEQHATKRRRLAATMELSVEQRAAFQAVREGGQSLFLTGGAGVGKSRVLNVIIDWLRDTLPPGSLGVTASTGIAAGMLNGGGMTLHSFAGVGLGQGTAQQLLQYAPGLRPKTKAVRRWQALNTLVIDEISMVDGAFLDKLDVIARTLRKRPMEPFGGARVLFCGDFLQLPPVDKNNAPAFAFESAAWQVLAPRYMELFVAHRQSGDTAFAQLLAELRMGVCSVEARAILETRLVSALPALPDDAIVTHLMPHNATVDAHNEGRLNRLAGIEKVFKADDMSLEGDVGEAALKTLLVPAQLRLKIGAQVMLLKNLDILIGLYNGAQGIVTEWSSSGVPRVRFESGLEREVSVAEFKVERDRVVLARRFQIPLRLSWSCTVHKSQGQTITSQAVIDAGESMFAPGQTYVALSRLQRLDQLRLTAFSPSAVHAHPRVVAWLETQRPPMVLLSY